MILIYLAVEEYGLRHALDAQNLNTSKRFSCETSTLEASILTVLLSVNNFFIFSSKYCQKEIHRDSCRHYAICVRNRDLVTMTLRIIA